MLKVRKYIALSLCVFFASWGMVSACGVSDDGRSSDDDFGHHDAGTDSEGGATVNLDTVEGTIPGQGPNFFASCSTDACDPRKQDCDDGTCLLNAGQTACLSPNETPKQEYDSCTSSEECAPGLACFETTDGAQCRLLCCPGTDLCEDDRHCSGSSLLVDSEQSTAWGYCTEPVEGCEVFNHETTCEYGEGCYIVSSSANTRCLRAGNGQVGDPCGLDNRSVQNLCADGLVCLVTQQCGRLCTLETDDHPCPSGEGSCVSTHFTPEGLGVCYQ